VFLVNILKVIQLLIGLITQLELKCEWWWLLIHRLKMEMCQVCLIVVTLLKSRLDNALHY
jgi:hypothetical protein